MTICSWMTQNFIRHFHMGRLARPSRDRRVLSALKGPQGGNDLHGPRVLMLFNDLVAYAGWNCVEFFIATL